VSEEALADLEGVQMSERDGPALKVLPVVVCREERLEEAQLASFNEGLKGSLGPEVQLLDSSLARSIADLEAFPAAAAEADAILIYKPHLGLGDCVLKVAEQGKPLIIFGGEGRVRLALDALEYLYPRAGAETWVAVDYQDIAFRLRLLAAKKRLANTRLLILNADYPHWERWICRVSGGAEAIRARLGLELEYLPSAELIKRWEAIDGARAASLAESWRAGAERVLEPTDEDLRVVARLYLAMRDLLAEKEAQGLTMAYGDDPLPVPCLAYMALRDEGLPAACEADILSLLAMVMVHHLLGKPSFMGNIFVNLQDGTITLSHCVAPRRMAGYRSPPLPYTLRDQHWGKAPGSVSAFVELEPGREVTICRLSGDLRSMLLARGKILDCRDLPGYCRMAVRIKLDGSARELVHRTSGNHHVMIYGDHRAELGELNRLLGIQTIEL
jgi:hypothetical protein